MATVKSKTELTRLGWIVELRRQGHRQCTDGSYVNNSRGANQVCALGLLREVAFPGWSGFEREMVDDIDEVGALAGLSGDQSAEVAARNDGLDDDGGAIGYEQQTFAEIADVVEGWFKQ